MKKRLISNKHIWVLLDGDTATIGITDYAQKKLGTIMFLNLPDTGAKVEAGQVFGDIESIKTVSDLFSPVDGEVLKINEELVDEPEGINENPNESWFVEVKVTAIPDDLMDEETYMAEREEF